MVTRTAVRDRVERLGTRRLPRRGHREWVLGALPPVLPTRGHVGLPPDPVTRLGTSPLSDVPGAK